MFNIADLPVLIKSCQQTCVSRTTWCRVPEVRLILHGRWNAWWKNWQLSVEIWTLPRPKFWQQKIWTNKPCYWWWNDWIVAWISRVLAWNPLGRRRSGCPRTSWPSKFISYTRYRHLGNSGMQVQIQSQSCCMECRIMDIGTKIIWWPSERGHCGYTTSESDRLDEIQRAQGHTSEPACVFEIAF